MSSLPKICHFSTEGGPHCKKETVTIVPYSSTVRQISCVFKTKIITIQNCWGWWGAEQGVDDEEERGEAGQVELGQMNYLSKET